MQHVFDVAKQVQALLDGSASGSLHQGLTTAEERSACSIPQVGMVKLHHLHLLHSMYGQPSL